MTTASRPSACLPAVLPWYVVHTKVRQEQVAVDNLRQQGFAVYLPFIKLFRRIGGRHQILREPLFSRYTFIRQGSTEHSLAPVRSTIGVATLVRFGQRLATISDETLNRVRDFEKRQNDSAVVQLSPFRCGKHIRVVEGPLVGLEGLVSEVRTDRVIVLLRLLGEETKVSLRHDELSMAH